MGASSEDDEEEIEVGSRRCRKRTELLREICSAGSIGSRIEGFEQERRRSINDEKQSS